ncbi:MAG: diiron oxygenase [Myxococcales bacterium]|nr:diiron oxygenase [Myxococcales bacterium]
MTATLGLGDLDLATGAATLLRRALRDVPRGETLVVRGTAPELAIHLDAFARAEGHRVAWSNDDAVIESGGYQTARSSGAERAGEHDPTRPGAVLERPPADWGLAARGALIEAGGPAFDFTLDDKDRVWADEAAALYRNAAAAQWDPLTAIPWADFVEPPKEVERAVVQVMTYLIENETAALVVPARLLGRIHPHFREIVQLLAIQAADEARHIEVFGRRAALSGEPLGLSTVSGRRSLKTLLDEPDPTLAGFLLSVLGEGTFLHLLRFLEEHAPDPVTRAIMRLAAQDEARHVAFGVAHVRRHHDRDPTLLAWLARAIEHRHDALRDATGLHVEVFDALVIIAGGGVELEAVRHGAAAVAVLLSEMQDGRTKRLLKIGFSQEEATRLAALHTKNFM